MAETSVVAASGGKALATAKLAVLSPVFGIVAVAGIIAFELWKGRKDAQESEACAQKET